MAIAATPESSLRRDGAESSRLFWAFAVSLMLHLLIFSTWYSGQRFGWWHNIHLPAWLQSAKMLTDILKKPPVPSPQQQEIPLEFVEVNPEVATAEPPKEAKYYSSQNSVAANPDVNVDSKVPKIEGKQTQVVKTEDVPREQFTPLQPVAPPEKSKPPREEPKPPEPELTSKPSEVPGDLALAKPDPTPRMDEGKENHSRPQTLTEALARHKALIGEKMKQEGGVKRRLEISSLDAKATKVGYYDDALVHAIAHCWYGLLDEQSYASDYRGKVVLQFRLHQDGNITDIMVVENTAGPIAGLICETAVDKPKPFEKFPAEMRRMVGDVRNIQFTFYYN